MPRMIIIRNPTAGRGSGARSWPRIQSLIEKHRGYWLIEERLTRPGNTAVLARQAVQQQADVVAAAGGDGTIMQVASELVGTEATLGLIPLGTGNDFCRSLGLHGDADLTIRTLFSRREKKVDVGRWGCQGASGIFINVAGTGFDAVVADRINAGYRFLTGTSAYLAAVVQSLATYRPAKMKVTIDGQSIETTAMLCAVANAQSYGGGMRIAPDAKMDDGLLDLVIVQGVGRIEFLSAFPKVFKGTHTTHPKVKVLTGKHIEIDSEPCLGVFADGERIGQTPVRFTIDPAALRILAP